jgi:hypothetical protein
MIEEVWEKQNLKFERLMIQNNEDLDESNNDEEEAAIWLQVEVSREDIEIPCQMWFGSTRSHMFAS